MKEKKITRRDFLRGTACGAAGLAFGLPLAVRASEPDPATPATAPRILTRAVLVRHAGVLGDTGRIDGKVLAGMLDDAVCALYDSDDPAAVWQRILQAEDVLGLKSNVWPDLPTPPELERAIIARARQAGIPVENISCDDRGVLDDPVFRRATALINVRPLRAHHWSGIGGCLKNYITFVRRPWQWHDDSCADLGRLWTLPVCRGRTRLNILEVLTPQFHCIGPHHFDPQHLWPYGGLLVGTDPVALDALGVKLLAEKRRRFFASPPRGGTSTKHVRLADTRHGIGTADPDRIELIRIGLREGALL